MSLVGKRVKVPSVKLFKDPEGKSPQFTIVGGIYMCDKYLKNKIAPYHIYNSNGESGWVKCSFSYVIFNDEPQIYQLVSDEIYIN